MPRTIPCLFVLLLLPSALGAQDQCATALGITLGSHVVAAIDGTQAPSPDCTGNNTVATLGEWYAFTPATDMGLKVTSDLAVNNGGDTRFHIYTGTCGQLTCVGGDDDTGVSGTGYLSLDSLNVNGGTTYYIVWDNRWNDLGFTFELVQIDEFSPPFGFTSLPIPMQGRALALVDMTNDGLDDIVTVDTTRIMVHVQQPDASLVLTTFTTPRADNEPTWSLCAGDLNGDGQNDLMYGGGAGVTMMLSNGTSSAYSEVSYPQYVFSQRGNMVDINNDGLLDAFMCHDVDPNVYYLNNGNGTLTYFQGGLGNNADGGNYGSIWVDYDNDLDMDLFIAKCRGGESLAAIDQLHRNNGDGTFTEVAPMVGLANGFHQSWSAAWGDYDRDGDFDVLVGASSLTFGGHKLFRNDAGMFTDVSAGSGLEGFTGTSTEWTTHDFNNDGRLDILGGGALHLGTGDLTFAYGLPLSNHAVGDMNNDGFLDLLASGAVRYNSTNINNWLRVKTVGTVSNPNGIGARVMVTSPLGTQIREIRSGDGFRFMSSLMAHFGLGQDEVIDEVRILWPSGLVSVVNDVEVNSTLEVIEGVNTGEEGSGVAATLLAYPNPAEDHLVLALHPDEVTGVTILDGRGRLSWQGRAVDMRIDVSGLAPGIYTVVAHGRSRDRQARFIKP